jgi:predicted transcriptional regulator
MDAVKAGLSEAEGEALRVLWDHGPGTVREVLEVITTRGRSWAYSTVATLLRRLESKGYSTSELVSGSLVYRAALSRDDLIERRLKDATAELCDGSAAPLVLALVQGNRFTSEELDRIRALIDQARQRERGSTKRRG